MAQQSAWDPLVQELLERHYDPAYTRSILSHYPNVASAPSVGLSGGDAAQFDSAARTLLEIAGALSASK
jgi:tRNA 2-selenouridine synthase